MSKENLLAYNRRKQFESGNLLLFIAFVLKLKLFANGVFIEKIKRGKSKEKIRLFFFSLQ